MPSYVEPFAGFSPKNLPDFTPAKPRRAPSPAERGFAAAVTVAERLQRQGISIDPGTLSRECYGMSFDDAAELLGSSRFAAALEERGISLHPMQDLSPRQAAALAIYLDTTSSATHAQKLRASGISEATWRGWLRQPKFASYMSTVSDEILAASIPVAKQRIAQGVDAGDIKFIDLALRLTGNNPDADVNVHAAMMAIFEILDTEVDPQTMRRIAEKVSGMMNGAQGAALRQGVGATTAGSVAALPAADGAVSSASQGSYVLQKSSREG
jgi:hypothetical protein